MLATRYDLGAQLSANEKLPCDNHVNHTETDMSPLHPSLTVNIFAKVS